MAALEAAAALTEPMVAVIGYAGLLLVMVNQSALAVLRRRSTATATELVVLAIAPVLRLAALTLENGPVHPVRHYALLGLTACAAACSAFVGFPELRPRLLTRSHRRHQLLLGLGGIPAGFLVWEAIGRAALGQPRGLLHSTPVVLALVVGDAIVEELLFRGLLQRGLAGIVGWLAPIPGTAALGLVYLGVRPVSFVCAVVVVGLLFAVIVEWTGEISGVVLAHLLLNVGLFTVWPRLLG
jgi:membrane protease YdiL (CAAX protease family)